MGKIDLNDEGNFGLRSYDDEPYQHVAFDGKFITVLYRRGCRYEVPLDRCKTAAQVLDWIHQLHTKTWFTPEMEKEFIDILFNIIPVEMWSGA